MILMHFGIQGGTKVGLWNDSFRRRNEKGQTWNRLGGILAPKSAQGMDFGFFWDDSGKVFNNLVSFGTI